MGWPRRRVLIIRHLEGLLSLKTGAVWTKTSASFWGWPMIQVNLDLYRGSVAWAKMCSILNDLQVRWCFLYDLVVLTQFKLVNCFACRDAPWGDRRHWGAAPSAAGIWRQLQRNWGNIHEILYRCINRSGLLHLLYLLLLAPSPFQFSNFSLNTYVQSAAGTVASFLRLPQTLGNGKNLELFTSRLEAMQDLRNRVSG